MLRLIARVALVLTALMIVKGCASMPDSKMPLHQSAEYYNYIQRDFESYIEVSRAWLSHNRSFISQNKQKEINMNAPFMLMPNEPTQKAVLLVHGLGDSPYSFSDIAKSLHGEGYAVHVLLLPGHGSKPSDLMLSHYEDWQDIVDHYALQLKKQYNKVLLGGFSTGANLVTINAIEQGGVDGLLLFSPGFETFSPFVERLAPIFATFMDWGWKAEEDNLARYRSSPINASIAYSESAQYVRDLFESKQTNVPTLIVMSEADSVINPHAIKGYFDSNFTHASNRFIWYGESIIEDDKIITKSMKLPELRISSGSHMSPLFAPDNPYYGKKGEKRMCGNSFNPSNTRRCEEGESVWFSAWGYSEEDKLFARLTWNPYYSKMEQALRLFLRN
ncbi:MULTISPECIES: carboxylesterase [unclassified Oleiphilus]|nr:MULTISPECIES: alpha/beta fold hydrolase [unclassified Oleiphilus]KZY76972.1 phospholipase [Oleiphilus sp. HI0068]KZY87734.1 phospholipase [Oleiphilus sp. HI0069]KZY88120.1 phospholipase [Oleiphilus sp. HI0072]KZZ11691.1 phospholipase [Oleiphilus sp. HI0078]KZZ47700.1 phospholipase [Oleiphilus sp. HI0085]